MCQTRVLYFITKKIPRPRGPTKNGRWLSKPPFELPNYPSITIGPKQTGTLKRSNKVSFSSVGDAAFREKASIGNEDDVNMIPQQWASPCGNQCTHKYAALMQIPWRVFCKKGCDADGETWEECLSECNEICYKDPVLKDQQWSAYIDRSPGAANYSEECFHACVSGCGFKFEICKEKVDQVRPNRPLPPKPPPVEKPPNPPATKSDEPAEDVPSTSA